MLMRDLDQIEPPEETGADRRRRTRKRTDTVGTTAPDHFAAPLALKPAREFLCFEYNHRRLAVAIDSIHAIAAQSGDFVEIMYGASSYDAMVFPVAVLADARIRTQIDAIGYVAGTLKVRDKSASPEALARECAAAVAARKLGDTPQVSRKGMALGSIIPHHPPADPTDATTLTGDEDEDSEPLTGEEVRNLQVAAHAAGLLIDAVTSDDEAVTGDDL